MSGETWGDFLKSDRNTYPFMYFRCEGDTPWYFIGVPELGLGYTGGWKYGITNNYVAISDTISKDTNYILELAVSYSYVTEVTDY